MLHGAEVLPRLHTNCAKLQVVKFNIQAVPNAPDRGEVVREVKIYVFK